MVFLAISTLRLFENYLLHAHLKKLSVVVAGCKTSAVRRLAVRYQASSLQWQFVGRHKFDFIVQMWRSFGIAAVHLVHT